MWHPRDKDNYIKTELPSLRVFKNKSRSGVVERASNECEVIVKDLFKKETNIDLFSGLKAVFSSGEVGTIEGNKTILNCDWLIHINTLF